MKSLVLALSLLVVASGANAACFGSGAFQTCSDSQGNTYNVQRSGNSTYLQGSNANTGSTWSQQSNTYGNTTQTYGNASNGQTWNQTTNTYGNTTNTYGTDSKGRSFNKTCNQFGCY